MAPKFRSWKPGTTQNLFSYLKYCHRVYDMRTDVPHYSFMHLSMQVYRRWQRFCTRKWWRLTAISWLMQWAPKQNSVLCSYIFSIYSIIYSNHDISLAQNLTWAVQVSTVIMIFLSLRISLWAVQVSVTLLQPIATAFYMSYIERCINLHLKKKKKKICSENGAFFSPLFSKQCFHLHGMRPPFLWSYKLR